MCHRLIALAYAGALWLAAATVAIAAQGSGCMPTTGIVSGLTFAQDVNAGLAALISSNSGNSAPATDCSAAPVKGQFWLDTSVTPSVLKQYDGTSWSTLGALDATNHLWAPPVGGGTAAVTAAATTDICAAPAAVQTVTGLATITSFGSSCAAIGIRKTLIFNSATSLTYNATSLIIPGQLSYTTSPGDLADAIYLGAGNWRIASITKIDGSSVTNPAIPLGTVIYGIYGTPPAKTIYGAGQAVSRASYPAYFAAVTRTQTATLTAGNNTITSVGFTGGIGAGMPIEGTGIQAGTVVSSVAANSIVMSKTATANGTQSISVVLPGYGSGGDSTTVGVLDCRGRTLAGRDDMNGSAANRLTPTYFGVSGGVLNSAGGAESKSLVTANLPPYTPSGSVTGTATSNLTIIQVNTSNFTPPGGGSITAPASNPQQIISTLSATFTGAAQGGTSTPFATVQPTAIAECAVVVLP
ncbi:hypothetical protein ACIPUD_10690 [Bradyrhizobium sp. CAR08]